MKRRIITITWTGETDEDFDDALVLLADAVDLAAVGALAAGHPRALKIARAITRAATGCSLDDAEIPDGLGLAVATTGKDGPA
jgi:hypothetical protein